MRSVVERFLEYVTINTQSDESKSCSPSTKGQLTLARLLEKEMKRMGLSDVEVDNKGYVYAKLPANTRAKCPKIGFVAHLDTSPDEKGSGVKPLLIKDEYGEDIVVSGGNTLLGADDKAGIAEIMTAVEFFTLNPDVKHGDVYIAFTPDEEIGRGTDYFDFDKFKADFAFTVDGGEEGEIEIENFNAAVAKIVIKGKPVHPGYAKNKMVNASILAGKIIEIISSERIPENSEGREGFYHITKVAGNVAGAIVECIIRDFDEEQFNEKKRYLKYVVNALNEQFGKGTAKICITDQYRNMFEIISNYPEIVELAKNSIKKAGVTPKLTPIRGGTDGVKLCFKGLPCPNLYTGGVNFHSKNEYIPVKSLRSATETIMWIITDARKIKAWRVEK